MEEAKVLFERNKGLVYSHIRKHWGCLVTKVGPEVVEQQASLALLRAAQLWRPEDGAFSTYATACIRGNLLTLNRRLTKPRSNKAAEFTGEQARLDTLTVWEPVDDLLLAAETRRQRRHLFSQMLRRLRRRDALVLYYRAQGHTLEWVARKLGVCRERVRQIVSRSYRTLRECPEFETTFWELASIADEAI
jgi:RNA polymerase sigma factor (sigma-70 family)